MTYGVTPKDDVKNEHVKLYIRVYPCEHKRYTSYYLLMDRSRRRTGINQRAQAMDGFISRPSSGAPRRITTPSGASSRPVTRVGQSSGGRFVDDFRRSEGFHAPTRRTIQPEVRHTPARPLSEQLNMDLPSDSGKHHASKTRSKRGGLRTFRRAAKRTMVATMLVAVVVGGFLFAKGYIKLHQVFQGGSTAAALKANVDPTLLKGEGDGRVNVLMMGIGGAQHDGGDLTDTMMIASIDPVNNQASLISIPRDMWTKMPNNYISNYQKLNAAYESGKYKFLGRTDQKSTDHKAVLAGFQAADSTIERITGVPIHYNISMASTRLYMPAPAKLHLISRALSASVLCL
jgi:hypothetical protein